MAIKKIIGGKGDKGSFEIFELSGGKLSKKKFN
jgi:hypothetical protein